LSDFISEISLGKMPRFNKQEIPSEVLWLIDRIETFAKKSVNANIALTNLSMGNLSFEIDKQAHFEQYYLLLVKLKNTLENLNQQVQDEKKIHSQLIWIKNGIDKLTEVMRREYDNPLLHANEIINMLVDYLKIPVGAIYLYKEQEGKKFVEMASAFAYGKEKQLYKKIVFGEGIVGTAASERKTINVTNVPENYFNIVSGFGETKPKNIIASPIKLKDEIFGVIELASMTRFKDDEINFVEEVCKTVAFSFAISKVYLDTMYLYENTNLEVAQLQAENESLINDYEDINTNYKNLVINSSDNNFIVARLNELSVRLTLDLDGNILELNSRFEQLFRSDRKKLMQSNYRDFMTDAKFLEEIDFEYFWREIRAGVQQEIEMGIVISNQEFWLKQYFYPVKDEMGRVKKIQVISFDITDKIFLKNQLDSLKSE
jgi:putative methionine-R-sulfoxide reductase with GAF domain